MSKTMQEIGEGLLELRERMRQIKAERDEAVTLLRRVIANHCPNDKLFCGTCTDARRFLATVAR